jgi:putative ABC transport system permease protein
LHEAFVAVDPSQPVAFTQSLDEGLENDGLGASRFSAALFSVFAAIGLLLAASGVFSIVSYTVTRRTREFGIRRALGATTGDILRLVTASTTKLLLAGMIIGLACIIAVSPTLAPYLRGWEPGDPATFVPVILLLLGVAFLACFLPARRATAIQAVTTRSGIAVEGKRA